MEEESNDQTTDHLLENIGEMRNYLITLFQRIEDQKNDEGLKYVVDPDKSNRKPSVVYNEVNVDDRRNEMEELKREYNVKLNEYNQKNDYISGENVSLKKQLQETHSSYEEQMVLLDKTRKVLHTKESENERLQEQLKQCNVQFNSLSENFEKVSKEMNRISESYKEYEEIAVEYTEYQNEMKKNCLVLQKTLEKIYTENVLYSKRNMELVRRNEELHQVVKKKDFLIQKEKCHSKDVEGNSVKIQEYVENLFTSPSDAQSKGKIIDYLKKSTEQNHRQEKQILEMSKKLEEDKVRCAKRQMQLEKMISELSIKKNELEKEMQLTKGQLEIKLRQTMEKLTGEKEKRLKFEANSGELSKKLQTVSEEYEKNAGLMKSLSDKINSLESENRRLDKNMQMYSKQAKELDDRNSTLLKENESLAVMNKNLEDEIFKKDIILNNTMNSNAHSSSSNRSSMVMGSGQTQLSSNSRSEFSMSQPMQFSNGFRTQSRSQERGSGNQKFTKKSIEKEVKKVSPFSKINPLRKKSGSVQVNKGIIPKTKKKVYKKVVRKRNPFSVISPLEQFQRGSLKKKEAAAKKRDKVSSLDKLKPTIPSRNSGSDKTGGKRKRKKELKTKRKPKKRKYKKLMELDFE